MAETLLPPIIIMGVSGAGKSTIGAMLGEQLGLRFRDGDDFHSAANRAKMSAGIALNDEDRKPWLEDIGRELQRAYVSGRPVIIACSALKRSYRTLLRQHAPDVVFIHLTGDRETLLLRMNSREDHFMPSSLLDSQLSTLEPLTADEDHVLADCTMPSAMLVETICGQLPSFT
jgi:gluconokinase